MAERGMGIRHGGRMEVLGGGDVWMEGQREENIGTDKVERGKVCRKDRGSEVGDQVGMVGNEVAKELGGEGDRGDG